MKRLQTHREIYYHYTDRDYEAPLFRRIIAELNNRFNTKEYANTFSFVFLAATKEYGILRKMLNSRLRTVNFRRKVAVASVNANKYAELDDVFNVMYRLRDVVYVMASNNSGKITHEHWETLLYIIKQVYKGSPTLLKDTHLPSMVELQLKHLKDMVKELYNYNRKDGIALPHHKKIYRRSWELFAIHAVGGLINKGAKFREEWGNKAFQSRAVNVSYWKRLIAWYQEEFPDITKSKPASKKGAATSIPPKEDKAPELKVVSLKQNCSEMTMDIPLMMTLKISTSEDTIKVAVADIFAVDDNLALKLENGLSSKEISLQGLLSFNKTGSLTVNTSTLRSRVSRYNAQEQQLQEEHKKAKIVAELKDKVAGASPEAKAFLETLLSAQVNDTKP